ncbi:MAG: UDP-N-acetylglucosamine 1-carboxyvinyltransferase [Candidatus Falkowbacteria bacterium]|nr:UDP-N-acetylglucosamine 1-carboxyvinyltransferase [Candidatus Falkowbacteria bacterium]
MSKFIIQGQKPLQGEITVGGAKNAALKIIPAAILSQSAVVIKNTPDIEDVKRLLEIFADLGGTIEKNDHQLTLKMEQISKKTIEAKFANKLRSSIMFVAPLLARTGEVMFPHPGGCVIGAGLRPIDLFIDGFQAMGAKVEYKDSYYHISAKRLKACEYFFTTVSVTGTESFIMAAVLAEGTSIIKNCAMEPEIVALAEHLNKCGAKITGAGTPTIKIVGVEALTGGEIEIIPDRIEAGTFAILAAAARAQLTIKKCRPDHLEFLLTIFKKLGIIFEQGEDWLKIVEVPKILPAYNLKTHEYPGFPTDLQSPFTVLMTQATGTSIIHETIYDRRLLFTDMLTQMGANVTMCDPHRVVIQGPTPLRGRALTSPDLRAGISMIIAGAIAEGHTEIDNIYQIERGYEKIDERLKAIGLDIKRAE